MAVLLIRMLPWIVSRFAVALWSFSFGATALATATEILATRGDTGAIAMIAPAAFLIANLLVVALVIGTARLLVAGKLLPPAARPVSSA